MGRLIDADRLKAHYAWWGDTESGLDKKRTFDTIVDLQPTAGPEWVPVPEVDPVKGYLPEINVKHGDERFGYWWSSRNVLAYCPGNMDDFNEPMPIVIAYYDKDMGEEGIRYGWSDAWLGDEIKPTAWMPLPEPYKEGE